MSCVNRFVLFAACILSALPATADEKPRSAMEHYEHVQKIRNDAGKVLAGGASTEAGLRGVVASLQGALDYLARPEVRELATGNIYLDGRRHDVHVDLASAYAQLGDKERALDSLEAAQRVVVAPVLGKMFSERKEFSFLLNEPRFKALLAKGEMVNRLWSTPNIATPFREAIPVEERVAGLSLFWAEARQNFVHFDNVPAIEWDKRYLEALSRVIAADTTRDYYDVLMKFAPLLGDGHTNIYAPNELSEQFYSRPPIRTQSVEDKVLITQVRSTSLTERVKPGDEIVEIDGLPVERYAAERVTPYVSSSTPQDKALRTYTYQLLSGDSRRAIALRLRNAAGVERIETIERTGYKDVQPASQFDFRVTAEGVAYIALDHFESNAGLKAFEKALPEIAKAKALIIDIRQNGGGSTNHGLAVLSYLTSEPILGAMSYTRSESALDRARGTELIKWGAVPGSGRPYNNKRSSLFTRPVAVLIGPQTFSAAEDFLVSFDLMKRGLIIGEATGGSTGQPLSFKLPGGGRARICVKRDVYPDGRAFVGKGISPGIEVRPTVADVRAGRDPVFERAVRELLRADRVQDAGK